MSIIEKTQIKPGKKIFISNVINEAIALTLADIINYTNHKSLLIITDDSQNSFNLLKDLKYFTCQKAREINIFPDLEILPYDNFSTSEEILSLRMQTLNNMQSNTNFIAIASISTLLKKIPTQKYIQQQTFILKKNQEISIPDQRQILTKIGYNHVDQVISRGEYSIRGCIIDIFPMGADFAYRIELFDNEIDTIRIFDTDTQRSIKETDKIEILPSHEFTLDEQTITTFIDQWNDNFGTSGTKSRIYQTSIKKNYAQGIEFYIPLFHKETTSLLEYIKPDTLIINVNDIYDNSTIFWQNIRARYEQLRYDNTNPILPPENIFYTPESFFSKLKNFPQINLTNRLKNKSKELPLFKLPNLQVNYQYKQPFKNLIELISHSNHLKTIFSVESLGRKTIILEKLNSINIKPKYCDSFNDALTSKSTISIIISPIVNGFIYENKYQIITEKNLYNNHIPYRATQKKTDSANKDLFFNDISELLLGDAVVHLEHGIGTYDGLTTLTMSDQINEYLTILYANDEKLYVPINNLHLINKYSGTNVENLQRNKLGNDKWEKTKEKALKKVHDVAAELLNIYASRSIKKGFKNQLDETDYLSFCQGFPFEETQDQAIAIKNVLDDMISENPMDRLICGDVGFGKTEVAMRAAYLAAHNNKQVAILVPTTLLAQQHFENFTDRFASLAINITSLSRFKTSKQQNEVINNLEKGTVDIIIGTHKLLSDKVKFKNLGLLIIDEEHRFGVTHKEKIKALRANIDILTMTATPIPRTLNMAFSSIRDLSIISTPPAKRRSVKTFVNEYKDEVIKEAVYRETLRGGQIYFLYNNVETIEKKAAQLSKLFPEKNIAYAHGQMREKELETIMYQFQKNEFQILVCTTIIETGIDIPNANTIIIERADKFGLAQLHQLRGRVGRSHHQAYAYLLTPPDLVLKKDATKRLLALEENESLGAGFILANHDLEIRGAGELLGKEQSGNMHGIGYNLYIDLLNKTTQALKSGQTIGQTDMENMVNNTEIELRIPALIPSTYIHDVHARLTFYQKISATIKICQLEDIKSELIDRFGTLTEEINNLFKIQELRLKSEKIGIKKIQMHLSGGSIEFKSNPNIKTEKIISMIQSNPGQFQISQSSKVAIKIGSKTAHERLQIIENILDQLRK